MDLDAGEILQADATVLAGVLILLTITGIFSESEFRSRLAKNRFGLSSLICICALSIGAAFAVFGHALPAAISMFAGLIALILAVGSSVWELIRPKP